MLIISNKRVIDKIRTLTFIFDETGLHEKLFLKRPVLHLGTTNRLNRRS